MSVIDLTPAEQQWLDRARPGEVREILSSWSGARGKMVRHKRTRFTEVSRRAVPEHELSGQLDLFHQKHEMQQ